MELKTFISQALQDIIGGVDHAQKRIPYGEIIPKREHGNVDVEFELTVSTEENEGEKSRLVVVAAAAGSGAKPPGGGPPPPGTPPPPPNIGKLKFKVPVRLPEERWHHIFFRWINEARLCFVRRKKRPVKLTAAEAAGGETTPPAGAQHSGTQSAEQAQQTKEGKRSYWGLD